MDDDAEIIHEFLIESYENLDQLDRDLVALEREPESRALLSSIFRTIHTIKGTSGFLAFDQLEQLTHVGENLLAALRDGRLQLTEERASLLLSMVDVVRALLARIEQTSKDDGPDLAGDLRELLTAALEDKPAAEPAPAPVQAEAPPVQVAPVQAAPVVESPVEPVPTTPAATVETPVEPAPVESAPAAETAVQPALVDPAPVEPAAPTHDHEHDSGGSRSALESSVRVDVDLLDRLVRQVGELVLTRNQVLQSVGQIDDADLLRSAQRLDLVASELQEGIMKTRMQPIGQVWSKIPRIVRDLSHQLGREIDLVMEGHETELDRSLLEALRDPLTHVIRNSIDHGIEPPADRTAAGKDATGRLLLRAYHESGLVTIEISDDGRGLDVERIGALAIDRGLLTQERLATMEPREIQDLVFAAGFSTAKEVTNVSGRGVGMDVVRTNIERIGGQVDLASEPGRGTTVRIRIPLTLAIIPALIVEQDGERYAIAQSNLVELVRLENEALQRDMQDLAGAPVLRLRGELLPLIALNAALKTSPVNTAPEAVTIVVVQSDDVRFGLMVDDVHDTQEIVVKPIGRILSSQRIYAGATIMGDGRVSLILDVSGLAQAQAITAVQEASAEADIDDVELQSLLVLELATGHRAALPLASVTRLEEVSGSRIERTGVTEVMQYRDSILPLIRLAPQIGVTAHETDPLTVVVHDGPHGPVGLIVDRVVDVVESAVTTTPTGRRHGVHGSGVVQGHVTDLLDVPSVLAKAGV